MSVHTAPKAELDFSKPLTTVDMVQAKGKRSLTMVTAYDYSMAQLADQAGLDMLLVGDSLGMVMLGRKDTVSVTLDEMIHHCRAVVQGTKRALLVGDMPFMTYETSVSDALKNAARLCGEGGVRAVKLEGGHDVAPQVRALVKAGIPVCGHLGLTPQRAAVLGGFKVQCKSAQAAQILVQDALELQDAGCFAIVLEALPAPVAEIVTARLDIPTLGIGAGPHCDGQVLICHDMFGLYSNFQPKFSKQYFNAGAAIREGFKTFVSEVAEKSFPAPEHCFTIKDEELQELKALLGDKA
ncbi:MAG: 3-methyl-2-oxobutanoate hydroxymethyltransferase [Deltaproteobacteria bacterium]|nr:3-methyl-2-oxobutanoate hydroxymethyltransferase [Deltaproteobacteria bacterium]